ncbi:TMV resistance protein N [Morus notabilis]|uniref:TMV resistance protein N n=1 Tax=Morus notabilis TaxID=981085 RepID=W9QWX6_9ROSA|nr:TMV resistance protein N [Morus notabilis]
MDMNYVQEILGGCGLYAETGLRHLLITVSERNKIMMHDLLRDMGRAVVEENLTNRPEERSRLWFHEDVLGVLKDEMGTGSIEGLLLDMERVEKLLKELKILNLSHSNYLTQTPDFSNLPNLGQLILKCCTRLSKESNGTICIPLEDSSQYIKGKYSQRDCEEIGESDNWEEIGIRFLQKNQRNKARNRKETIRRTKNYRIRLILHPRQDPIH